MTSASPGCVDYVSFLQAMVLKPSLKNPVFWSTKIQISPEPFGQI